MLSYVLVTPARNEEENIDRLIQSMAAQTHPPLKWIIVSDGSTDKTDAIVEQYLPRCPWMELVRMTRHGERNFSAKARAFNAGYAKAAELDYDIIGNLDADISFDDEYFAFLTARFDDDPALGCAGTPFVEDGKHYDYRFTNIDHVSGACQLFRKECFEDIGGYVPIEGGGIDFVAVTTARMRGWKTRTFTEKTCRHHRKMGTGTTGSLLTSFRQGRKDYCLGNHPLWELFRAAYQMTRKPTILGGTLIMAGYTWSALSLSRKSLSNELESFIRAEQMRRLKEALRGIQLWVPSRLS